MAYESDTITQKLNELVLSQGLYMGLIAIEDLNGAEKALAGTCELMNEVYNGGFMQYFHNSSGEHAKPMIGILRSIDAEEAADILRSAMTLAGPGTPWGDEPNYLVAINMMPDDTARGLADLERKLFDQSDDLHLRLFRYLSNHRDQINAPKDFWTEADIQ
jgi:Domain of unknown function (DUF4375)